MSPIITARDAVIIGYNHRIVCGENLGTFTSSLIGPDSAGVTISLPARWLRFGTNRAD